MGGAGPTWQDNQAIGKEARRDVPGHPTGDQPWDIATTPADITDGMSQHAAGRREYPGRLLKGHPVFGRSGDELGLPAAELHVVPGFGRRLPHGPLARPTAWEVSSRPVPREPPEGLGPGQPGGTFENIAFGQSLRVEGSFPFANSAHPGGANFVFCDGAVRFISNTIDGAVYAELITPAERGRRQGSVRSIDRTLRVCELRPATASTR